MAVRARRPREAMKKFEEYLEGKGIHCFRKESGIEGAVSGINIRKFN